MAYPRRIAGPNDFEYECLYRFYERLEQRERLQRIPRLTTVALLVSAPILMAVFSWAVCHNVEMRQSQVAGTISSPL